MTPPDAMASRLAPVLAGRGEIALAMVFGSTARSRTHAGSDIDLAVLGLDASERARLAGELAAALGREVDVVDAETTDVPLLEALVRDAIRVHEGRPGAWASWRARALVTLENDRPRWRRMRDGWLVRLAGG